MASGPINPQTGGAIGTAVGGPGVGTVVGSVIGWLGQHVFSGPDPNPVTNGTLAGYALPSHLGTRLIAVVVALILLTIVAVRLTVEG